MSDIEKSTNDIVDNFVEQLKRGDIDNLIIPKEYLYDMRIVKEQREWGLRKTKICGYDVIRNNFFVEEDFFYPDGAIKPNSEIITFATFEEYYNFVEGEIYENSCYYEYYFSEEEIIKFNINSKKISTKSFCGDKAKNYNFERRFEDVEIYDKGVKEEILEWIKILENCNTYIEFSSVVNSIRKSKCHKYLDIIFCKCILRNKESKYKIAIELLNNGEYVCGLSMREFLCYIYLDYDIINDFEYKKGTKITRTRQRNAIRNITNLIKQGIIFFNTRKYYDKNLKFFCEEINGYGEYDGENVLLSSFRNVFEDFDSFSSYLNCDLSGCDLSEADFLEVDFKKYKSDINTKYPVSYYNNLKCVIVKYYDYNEDLFVCKKSWVNENNISIKEYRFTFRFFIDFLEFCDNDLSNSDLLLCEGLINIKNYSDIKFDGAKLSSLVMDKFSIEYRSENLCDKEYEVFENILHNEGKNILEVNNRNEIGLPLEEIEYVKKAYYVSDLHLEHKIKNKKCKTLNDVECLVYLIIDGFLNNISSNEKSILFIAGDISSEFQLFEIFIKILHEYISRKKLKIKVFIVLGNHELWGFNNICIDDIFNKYKLLLEKHDMFLVQNNLYYLDKELRVLQITNLELKTKDIEELRQNLLKASLIIFGGVGFSGLNEVFNADNGVYKNSINRIKEIQECKVFNELYNKIKIISENKQVVILTHMPTEDWAEKPLFNKNCIYVNGHTHLNQFYDDGVYRLYADNQVGYKSTSVYLKNFYLNCDYDIFTYYNDGIYEITTEQYKEFYRGKNIKMSYSNNLGQICMLKKKEYYCFIVKGKNRLYILNGGAVKELEKKQISYYYENMDKLIEILSKPLLEYDNFQKQLAAEIRAIGGSGVIHGAIVDIDFYNHIYVNPIDMSITAYFAGDMIKKVVYSNFDDMIKEVGGSISVNYLSKGRNEVVKSLIEKHINSNEKRQVYLNTDIYGVSKELSKIKKLNSKILSVWYEETNKKIEE